MSLAFTRRSAPQTFLFLSERGSQTYLGALFCWKSRPQRRGHALSASTTSCRSPSSRVRRQAVEIHTSCLRLLDSIMHGRRFPPPSLTDLQVALTHPVIHIEHFKKLFFSLHRYSESPANGKLKLPLKKDYCANETRLADCCSAQAPQVSVESRLYFQPLPTICNKSSRKPRQCRALAPELKIKRGYIALITVRIITSHVLWNATRFSISICREPWLGISGKRFDILTGCYYIKKKKSKGGRVWHDLMKFESDTIW